MKSLNLLFSICIMLITFSCQGPDQSSESHEIPSPQLSVEHIEELTNSFQSLFNNVSARVDDVELLTYELVANLKTGEMAIMNLKVEPYMPIHGGPFDERSNDRTTSVYVVECQKEGEIVWTKECNNKFSCGSAIADCLEIGGCASICEDPRRFDEIREADISLLQSYGISDGDILSFYNVASWDLLTNVPDGSDEDEIASVKGSLEVFCSTC